MFRFFCCFVFIILLVGKYKCEEDPNAEEEFKVDEDLANIYTLLNRMYGAVTHGDARYFIGVLNELRNDTYVEKLVDNGVMQAIENNFVHILNTMHIVDEISLKIHASPQQIKSMNDGLFVIFKSMISFLDKSSLNSHISDKSYKLYLASFSNLMYCEGLSLSLQFRLIKPLKYLLMPNIMNNSEQYYCFDTYHNIINQTLLHISTKSRASGFARLFFHLPNSLPILKHLHINNKNLMKNIKLNNPIINQQMIKRQMSDIDILLIIKASIRLNMPKEWYLRKDINGNNAFHLWIKRAPYYLQNVYFHAVISKIFTTNYKHILHDNSSCLNMMYIANYSDLNIIKWFPLPDSNSKIHSNEVMEVHQQNEFDALFPEMWLKQEPMIFRGGIINKWNLSDLNVSNLSNIFENDIFVTSSIPYQELYDFNNYDEMKKKEKIKERSITFTDYINIYYNDEPQSANMHVMCNQVKEFKKKQKKLNISYIFDNTVYWRNELLQKRFNLSYLIPTYIHQVMQLMIDDYYRKVEEGYIEDDEMVDFEINQVIDSITMLKQFAVGGLFTGAQPHFHGPAFNGLIFGEKKWLIFPPHKSFQMKQTAIEFFCYHDSLSLEKKQNLTYYSFTQHAGDVVFIPSEWGHAVLNTQALSIGVAAEIFI